MTPSYEGLGNLTDGRLLWWGDFRGTGRAQLLFMYPQDRNWWLGSFSNAAMEMSWIYAGNTSGFGDLSPVNGFGSAAFR